MVTFGNFCQKYLRQISILGQQVKDKEKLRYVLLLCQFQKSYENSVNFFWFCTPWYLKLTLVSNTFCTKILKSSHSEAVEDNMDNTLFCNLDECNDRG